MHLYIVCMNKEKGLLFSFVYVSHTKCIYTICRYKSPAETCFAELCVPYLSKPGEILVLLNGNLPWHIWAFVPPGSSPCSCYKWTPKDGDKHLKGAVINISCVKWAEVLPCHVQLIWCTQVYHTLIWAPLSAPTVCVPAAAFPWITDIKLKKCCPCILSDPETLIMRRKKIVSVNSIVRDLFCRFRSRVFRSLGYLCGVNRVKPAG